MAQWTVFTGDIVKSSDLSSQALDAIFARLEQTARDIAGWQDGPAPFARYRGDGWQMALAPEFTFRAALALRASVRSQGKGYDTRIGIGLGAGKLGNGALNGAEGEAFVTSGHALDHMKRTARMAAPTGPLALRVALPLADRVVAGWTARQAEVVLGLLPPQAPSQASVADHLGTTRQTAQKQAEAAGITALYEVFELLESKKQPK